jgi:hypothetical protein
MLEVAIAAGASLLAAGCLEAELEAAAARGSQARAALAMAVAYLDYSGCLCSGNVCSTLKQGKA